jgi:hypothetical protein
MAEGDSPRAEDQLTVNGSVLLQDLPVGTKVRLRSGAVGEVTANPRDGGWIFVRFVEHPKDSGKVGEEDMVFCADVLAVVT